MSDCPFGARARGLCAKHYQRWRRHGDPMVRKPDGPGLRMLPMERQREIRHRAGVKGTNVRWLRWLLAEVRRVA